jgi:hypothetical protein
MTDTWSVSAQAKQTFFVSVAPDLDIEYICREFGEEEDPPNAFLVSGEAIADQLLAISLKFLEEGQQLPCPGLPLAGAAFDPDWGFSQAEVAVRRDGTAEFRLPSVHFETLASGDVYGYRLCIIDNHEVPEVIGQLAHIRAELTKRRREPRENTGVQITITQL